MNRRNQIIKSGVRILNRLRLRNKEFSLVTNTCLGGLISHELGQQFRSPNVNCGIFSPAEFNIFCTHLEHYVNLPIEFIPSEYNYPVGVLHGDYGDVTVNYGHYRTEEEARQKWCSRAKRLNMDNLFVLVDGDNCPDEDVYDFEKIPVKNKAILTLKEYPGLKSVYVIKHKGYKQGALLKNDFCGGAIHWFEIFDYVHFFNTGKIRSNRFFRDR